MSESLSLLKPSSQSILFPELGVVMKLKAVPESQQLGIEIDTFGLRQKSLNVTSNHTS